jgi:hypothetical protein
MPNGHSLGWPEQNSETQALKAPAAATAETLSFSRAAVRVTSDDWPGSRGSAISSS